MFPANMSERSSSSSADARQEVGHDRDLVSSLSWHVQRAMLFGVAAFTAIAALYVVAPPTQPAEAIATLSAAVALGCAAVVLLNRLIGATHARAVAFLAGPDSDFITGMTMMFDGGQTILH